ncbi:MAG: tautomerase family protein [Saccharofermentans sp.]|nr:tautomerase family protein [Saccharofermentans sp.]
MPYIAIKGYPKDEETKRKVAEQIHEIFAREWGCPATAISISVEEVAPENWEDQIVNGEIRQKQDKMFIVNGQKQY